MNNALGPPSLLLSRDKLQSSLEWNKRLRERHRSFVFCSTTSTVVSLANIDRHVLRKNGHYGHSCVLYHLQWWVGLSSWLLIHAPCISHSCFSPGKSSVSLPAWFLSVVLHLSIFLIRLRWWMNLLLMTLWWCQGGVWLCPDQEQTRVQRLYEVQFMQCISICIAFSTSLQAAWNFWWPILVSWSNITCPKRMPGLWIEIMLTGGQFSGIVTKDSSQ